LLNVSLLKRCSLALIPISSETGSFPRIRRLRGALTAFFLMLSWAACAVSAPVPDAALPGGAQADRQFSSPVPPNMRRFLATPKMQQQLAPRRGGERQITVNSIHLDGVVDRPEFDIMLDELVVFVEQKRQDLLVLQHRRRLNAGEYSLTEDERNELLEKIDEVEKNKKTTNRLKDVEAAIEVYRQKFGKSNVLSLHQLQEIAADVAQYYRNRGFILVHTVIPPQTIHEGRVHIRIQEGILGNVSIEKNTVYSQEQLLRPFRELLGKPVIKESIEEAMLSLNDYPGLQTFAVFQPGLLPGETSLLVSVLAEKHVNAALHGDNYGSEFTGEYRTRLDFLWHNPTNGIDQFRASLSKTLRPANGNYGALFYERHAFGIKNTFGIGASRNNYILGSYLAPFGITGNTVDASVYWRRAFQRSRLFNSYALLQFLRKSTTLNVVEGEDRADELSVFSVESGFDWSSLTQRHQIRTRLQYSQGFEDFLGSMKATSDPTQTTASRRGGSGLYAGSDFSKTNIEYDQWYRFKPKHTLHVSFRSQFSKDLLTSLEQMPLGGPGSVRAYSAAEFLRDKAISANIEWLMNAPGFAEWKAFGDKTWGELLQVSLFVDYAKGWLNNPLASDRAVINLSGVGAGLSFNYNGWSSRFEFAFPIGDEVSSNGRRPQYFMEVNFGF
jgi:hemolysin activation/secretion protein